MRRIGEVGNIESGGFDDDDGSEDEEGDGVGEGGAAEATTVGSTSVRLTIPFSNSKEKNAGLVGRDFLLCDPEDDVEVEAFDLLRRGAEGER